jgi:hypothetical protein
MPFCGARQFWSRLDHYSLKLRSAKRSYERFGEIAACEVSYVFEEEKGRSLRSEVIG